MINLGIIGCGPRGLAALECLFAEIAFYEPIEIKVHIFDPEDELGAGQVWQTAQSDANWINITLRGLSGIKGREAIKLHDFTIPFFPKFTSWLEDHDGQINTSEKDIFLLRSTMGKYLNQRFSSIAEVLLEQDILTINKTKIAKLQTTDANIIAVDVEENTYDLDECLLSVGHQQTELDDQPQSWVDQIEGTDLSLFTTPYDSEISNLSLGSSSVAVRGLGLSTIDVIRKLVLIGKGKFSRSNKDSKLVFHSSDSCPDKIVPFSLDGLIAAPKPINMIVDRHFEPSSTELSSFEESLVSILENPNELTSYKFLISTFTESFVDKFADNFNIKSDQLQNLVKSWLENPSTKDDIILDTDLDLIEYMRALSQMAMGEKKATLDYTIGQYWRWLQPSMYQIISHCGLSDKIMNEVITIDEQTKRYSYGPPVESTLQLIAMAENGIVDLSMVTDPDIDLDGKGWKLSKGNNHVLCNVMINSVLSSPTVNIIEDGPIRSLIDNKDLDIVSSDLGISTRKDGIVLFNKETKKRIGVLGRNAKGSVLGVDAILECFGPRIKDWAFGVCCRIYS